MNWHDFIFSSYETILAIIFSLITVFISNALFSRILLKAGEDKTMLYKNPAVALFGGVNIICVLLLVHACFEPVVKILKALENPNEPLTLEMFVISFLYFLMFFGISLILSQLLILLTSKLYFAATRSLDEIKEIKNNNLGVSIIISAVILGTTLAVKSPFEHFLAGMVNRNMGQEITTEENLPEEPIKKGQKIVFPMEDEN